MKSSKVAIIALLLWVITVAVFAWFFIRGNTTAGTDSRVAIVLQSSERELILLEMRGLLSATQGILDGANQGDMNRIAQSARSAGMAAAADVDPSLMTKLPLAFKTLGMSVHHDMDEIAAAAEGGKPALELLKMTSNTLTKCVTCHASWQLIAGN
jgi:hypothetical protein